MDTKTVVIIGLVVYFVFIRQPAGGPAGSQYRPVPPPQAPHPSTTQQIVSGVTGALPAIGSFLNNVFGSSSSSSANFDDYSDDYAEV